MAIVNIGILAHVDAGKTTLTERILFETGVIRSVGSVDKGTTQTDTMELERARGITIKSAVVSFQLNELKVNLVDTPGHPDFVAEVERSLRVLDGVVLVVSAVEGVQSQTRRLARAIRAADLPMLIFVNKIDRIGARSEQLLDDIQRKLKLRVVPMTRSRQDQATATRRSTRAIDEPGLAGTGHRPAGRNERAGHRGVRPHRRRTAMLPGGGVAGAGRGWAICARLFRLGDHRRRCSRAAGGCRGVAPGGRDRVDRCPSRHGLQDRAPAIGREDRLRAALRREAAVRDHVRSTVTPVCRAGTIEERITGDRSLRVRWTVPQRKRAPGTSSACTGCGRRGSGTALARTGSSPRFWLRLPAARTRKRGATGRSGTDYAATRLRSSTWRSKIR